MVLSLGFALREWRRLRPREADLARDFLLPREERCVAAMTKLLELERGGGNWGKHSLWLGSAEGVATSLLFFAAGGTLYPVLDNPEDESNRRALERLLRSRRVRSIQGTLAEVRSAEKAIQAVSGSILAGAGGETSDPVDYFLMSLKGEPRPEALSAGPSELRVRRGGPEDAERLFPLQEAYEVEEVVPTGGAFNPAVCRLVLEASLRGDRTTLYAELGGTIVAKAGTNALGAAYDQIGGVYVLPGLRGRGIATRLVAELCRGIVEKGKRASLFVKKSNPAARRAYQKIGFEVSGDYRITYFL